MDVYNLEKTDIILDIPWLIVHNPEINWKTGEVKMMKCLLLCRKIPEKKIIKTRKTRKINVDDEIDLRWIMKEKKERKEEVKKEKRVEEMVPKRFHK